MGHILGNVLLVSLVIVMPTQTSQYQSVVYSGSRQYSLTRNSGLYSSLLTRASLHSVYWNLTVELDWMDSSLGHSVFSLVAIWHWHKIALVYLEILTPRACSLSVNSHIFGKFGFCFFPLQNVCMCLLLEYCSGGSFYEDFIESGSSLLEIHECLCPQCTHCLS